MRHARKIRLRYKKERVVLSDVLPYEMPFIFSNRHFYRFLVRCGIETDGDSLRWRKDIPRGAFLLLKMLSGGKVTVSREKGEQEIKKPWASIPFSYDILHKPGKTRRLTIIHPLSQIRMVEIYEKYRHAMLHLCSRSRFSLRSPHKIACYFYYRDRLHNRLLGRKADKVEMFFSEYENLRTYFSYRHYSNIYKFYEDYRYQRCEKKFCHLLKFDIQGCFDSIYTHSIAWAAWGGMDAYKDHFTGNDKDFFASRWDTAMQRMNYNETNGVVIGPEFSRIFAEVILQHIDQRVERELLDKGRVCGRDYACFRYVDDYFLFFNDERVKDEAQTLFGRALREFKMNISTEKTQLLDRPFVTPITRAKLRIDELLKHFFSFGKEERDDGGDSDDNEEDTTKDRERLPRTLDTTFRFHFAATFFNKTYKSILMETGVEAKDVLNYTLARIATKTEKLLKKSDKPLRILSEAAADDSLTGEVRGEASRKRRTLERGMAAFLTEMTDSVFFLYSMSRRVNTTLKVIQTLNTCIEYINTPYASGIRRFTPDVRDTVQKKMRDEISLVLQTPFNADTQIETLYLLVALRGMNGRYQLHPAEIERYLKAGDSNGWPPLNALAVSILLYYFRNQDRYKELKAQMLDSVRDRIKAIAPERRKRSAECAVLCADLAACPFLEKRQRKEMCRLMGLSEDEAGDVLEYLDSQGQKIFTKWTGVNVTKELCAKVSQEVYS